MMSPTRLTVVAVIGNIVGLTGNIVGIGGEHGGSGPEHDGAGWDMVELVGNMSSR